VVSGAGRLARGSSKATSLVAATEEFRTLGCGARRFYKTETEAFEAAAAKRDELTAIRFLPVIVPMWGN
jgi:hypothetical protein